MATTNIQLVSRGLQGTSTNPTNHDSPYSTPSTCAESDFVDCVNGFLVRSNDATTCAAACLDVNGDAKCCSGTDACTGFTGKVCKDGSCSGLSACLDANIPEVINSCKPWDESQDYSSSNTQGNDINPNGEGVYQPNPHQYGDESCIRLNNGSTQANIDATTVVDSCWGTWACWEVAKSGRVGKIENSCHSSWYTSACGYMGSVGDVGVGDVVNSCYGMRSCYNVAYGAGSSVGSLINACGRRAGSGGFADTGGAASGEKVCYSLGWGGIITTVTDCCKGLDTDLPSTLQCGTRNLVNTDAQLIGRDPTCAAGIVSTHSIIG